MPKLNTCTALAAFSLGPATPRAAPAASPIQEVTEGLPDDVWLHHILPRLPLIDVLSLGRTCRRLHAFTTSPWLWRTRTRTATPAHEWVLGGSPPRTLRRGPVDAGQWTRDAAVGIESGRLVSLDVHNQSWRYAPPYAAQWAECVPPFEGEFVNQSPVGPPAFVQIESVYGGVLGLDLEGKVWIVNSWFEYRGRPFIKYGHLPLPFSVVALAADQLNATVLDTDGKMWELRNMIHWLDAPEDRRRFRVIPHILAAFAPKTKAGAEAELEEKAKPEKPRIVQLFAAARSDTPLMGGCVTADGRVHVWIRTAIATLPVLRIPLQYGARLCRYLSPGDPESAPDYRDIVHTLPPLPDVRSVAMGEDYVIALSGDGAVWVIGMDVEPMRPVFTSWHLMPDMSTADATHVAAFGRMVVAYFKSAGEAGRTVRLGYMPAKHQWSLNGFGAPSVQAITYPDPVAEVAISAHVLAVITTRGELYTCVPHVVLSLPVLPVLRQSRLTSRPLDSMPSTRRSAPFAFTLTVDRGHVYVMLFSPPVRRETRDSAAVVALRGVAGLVSGHQQQERPRWWSRAKRMWPLRS